MKTLYRLIIVAASALYAISCASETEVYPVPDSLNPRTMTPALFTDIPEGLVEELGVEDGIPSSLCAFFVRKDGKNILFDSGNGAEDSQLLPGLKSLGVSPEDIDYVFITHLHGDHIGGMVTNGQPTFPNATVYINKDEYNGWDNVADMEMMKVYSEHLDLFDTESTLPCGIEAIKAYGHTPGHTVYRTGDIIFAGDIMHGTALQLVNPDSCARFDSDKEKSAATRKAMLDMFKEEGLKVYGMHFPDPFYIQF